jgi:hypothetical protein
MPNSDAASGFIGLTALLRVAGILLVALLQGCASQPPLDLEAGYPIAFPRLAQAQTRCPAFSAAFSNTGIKYNSISSSLEKAIFSRDVLGQESLFLESAALSLTIENSVTRTAIYELLAGAPPRNLRLVSESGQEWRSPLDTVVCVRTEQAEPVYIFLNQVGASAIGIGAVQEVAKFALAMDGSLVVKRSHQEGGIVLVVPYQSTTGVTYYRFPPASQKPVDPNP